MKRWYLVVAVAGLLPVAPVSAQPGALAPTAPVVPAPMLQNGNLVAPAGGNGGWGGGTSRAFQLTKWSPFRNPATASAADPGVLAAPAYGHPLPPLPTGVSGGDGHYAPVGCAPAGCAPAGRDRSYWTRMKAWLCYHPSNTELPRLQPTPYVTPLQGMFPCTSVGGCTTGCATGCASGAPVYGQPQLQGQPMPQPMSPAAGAGAVMMPPRGPQGTAVQQTWQGRTTPAAQFAAKPPAPVPAPNPVVGASLTYPAPK